MTDSPSTEFVPVYSAWRHGGWYVHNVNYPNGAVGCVSRNYADRKWRIVCSDAVPGSPNDRTFPNRDAAAHAELALAESEWQSHREKFVYDVYRQLADALPYDVLCDLKSYAHLDTTLRVAMWDSADERRSTH